MKSFFRNYIEKNHWFWFLSVASVILLVAAFCVPPTGVIDPSVIAAVGELAGFAAIGAVIKAIEKGTGIRMTKGDVTVQVQNDDIDE